MKKHIKMLIMIGIISVALFASVQTVYADSEPEGCIAFTSDLPFYINLGDSAGRNPWDGTVQVSTNGTDWNEYTTGNIIESYYYGDKYSVFFRGRDNTCLGNTSFKVQYTDSISCSGNIENLLDYTVVQDGQHPVMIDNAFANLFEDCNILTEAPELSATTLVSRCYGHMFKGCTSLTKAPELPATTLAYGCYEYMFYGCESLTEAPALPATTLTAHCYEGMFHDCTSLTEAPELPATTLAGDCYWHMFEGCTSLTKPPALPATTLINSCYNEMFQSSGVKISSEKGIFDGVFYAIPYRIPEMGEGTYGRNSLSNMFTDTKGPFTGTPEINTTYYLPCAIGTPLTTMKSKGKKNMTIAWEPVEGADGYDIFFAKCSKKDKKTGCKLVMSIEGNDISQWTKTGLKKGKSYKAYVQAYVKNDGKEYIESSPLMHAYAAGGDKKYTNAKSVSVNKDEVSLQEGNTFKLKPKVKKLKKNKKLMPKSHVSTLRYLSTDKQIATVNMNGQITAKGAGECYVYAYAHNGVFAKVQVTVTEQ